MGSFADRAAQDSAMQGAGFQHDARITNLRGDIGLELGKQAGDFNLQGIVASTKPQQTRADLEVQQYADAAPQRKLATRYADIEGNMIGQIFGDHGAATTAGATNGLGFPEPLNVAKTPPSAVRPAQAPATSFGNIFSGAMAPAAGAPTGGATAAPTQDQLLHNWAYFKNPGAMFDAEHRAQERKDTLDTADTEAFTKLAASPDPRLRAIGIAGLQKTRAFGQLNPSTVQGLSKPLVSVGEDFINQPAVQTELKAIGSALVAASQDTNAQDMAQALKPRIDRLVARASEAGADPNQVLQAIKEYLGRQVEGSSLYTNPITTTLRAIPGLGDMVPQASRDVARQGVGL